MVEFSLVHSITTEMCTGFLTLAAIGVMMKFLADGYMKRFHGKVKWLDKLASVSSRYAEPAAFFGLGAGIFMTFVSMVTGTLSWPMERLMDSGLAHNKVLFTVTSQVLFIGAFIIRIRHTYEIWMDRMTTWLYFLLVESAFVFIWIQNSVAGQMAKGASLLDVVFPWLKDMESQPIIFPFWGSMLTIILTIVIIAAVVLIARRRREISRKPVPA